MKCPYCGSKNTKVTDVATKDSRLITNFPKSVYGRFSELDDYRMRRRKCRDCEKSFLTIEQYCALYDE